MKLHQVCYNTWYQNHKEWVSNGVVKALVAHFWGSSKFVAHMGNHTLSWINSNFVPICCSYNNSKHLPIDPQLVATTSPLDPQLVGVTSPLDLQLLAAISPLDLQLLAVTSPLDLQLVAATSPLNPQLQLVH